MHVLHFLTAVFRETHNIEDLDKISSVSYYQGPASLDQSRFVIKEFAERN